MITIDDVTYTEDQLSDVSKAHVERINELRREAASLQMILEEKKVLIHTYAASIKNSVEVVEDKEEAINE